MVRYESVIHEFDPYFNFRTTKYLAHEGFLEFLNWFDDRGWYPLGRTIGGTIYPGLMLTAASLYWFLNSFFISINIRNVCVFLAPLFSANAAIASYLLTTEVTKKSAAGLLAAAFTAVVPSYISRYACSPVLSCSDHSVFMSWYVSGQLEAPTITREWQSSHSSFASTCG